MMTFIIRARAGTKTCAKSYGEDNGLDLKYFLIKSNVNQKQRVYPHEL